MTQQSQAGFLEAIRDREDKLILIAESGKGYESPDELVRYLSSISDEITPASIAAVLMYCFELKTDVNAALDRIDSIEARVDKALDDLRGPKGGEGCG